MAKKSKSMCAGCEDNFYNGNNQYGVKECWSFKKAKVKNRKRVAMSDRPPWKWKGKSMLSCYHQKGYWFVDGDRKE